MRMTNLPAPIALDRFDVAVDRDAEVPIGVQLAWALRTRIHDGRFKPGQRLPALREVAKATGVNINTVRSVYRRLDQEGLLDSQQGSGTFVAPTRRAPSEAAMIAANAAREAHETGIDPREVAAALYVSPLSPLQRSGDAASRRRSLRTQIAVLERAVGEIEASHPGLLEVSTATRPGPGPTLLGIDELERVRTQLVRRLASVQGAIDVQMGEDITQGDTQTARQRKRRAPKPATAKTPKRASRPSSTRPAPAGT
jgi:DNA-binding transcriptional regulator YhcF (GntR family)